MRVVIAGGGTGGHVIPALAIARELQSRYAAEVLFIGTARGVENKMVPPAGFPLKLVQVGALKNVSMYTRAKTMFDLPRAVLSAGSMLSGFKADVVVGVGGYASGPAMIAAVLNGIPTLAFEPNVVPGFANKMVGRWVSAAAVHFEETTRYFRNAKVTGVPVRSEFFMSSNSSSKTLLVTGGSQGARAINRAVTAALPELARIEGLHIVHQTGERDYEETRAAYEKAGVAGNVSPFIQDMAGAFAQAALILCRSGASTVAEIAAAGKPAIFIPFPFAADDHQTKNAEALAGKDAAMLIAERDLTPATLSAAVTQLVNDPVRLQQIGARAKELSHPQAAQDIGEMVKRLAEDE
ncbi:MAG TPA: undecaprenyldiphospho-muramoylpentapeptide beta-N-acetylglucosaminyltransferase [Terriglobales bacterium]|nr:undecaprenyldiphospho-muramoylpentapeptide beta-N-acetylglucosaminyltransferase [Terriglobales bacterium]